MIEDELKYKSFNFKISLHHRNHRKIQTTVIKFDFERPGYLGKKFCYHDSEKDYDDLCKIIDLKHSPAGGKTGKANENSKKCPKKRERLA